MENDVFFAARDRFLSALNQEQRLLFSPCAGREDLLAGLRQIEALAAKFKKRRGVVGVLDLISSFAQRLEPFCKIIDIFVSAKPEVGALIWGAVRLILQLASSFGNFLDRTVKVLGRIGETFPQLMDLAKLLHLSTNARLRDSIESVYCGIFEVFQTLVVVFFKSDGRAKGTIGVASSIIWRPFDVRLSESLQRLAFHQQVMRDELDIAQARAMDFLVEATKQEQQLQAQRDQHAAETQEQLAELKDLTEEGIRSIEKKLEEEAVFRIQQWLAPPSFASPFEDNLGLATEDTGDWFLNDHRFETWCQSAITSESTGDGRGFDSRTLWVHGKPGCGKTVLASIAVDEMKSMKMQGADRSEIAYYFFRFDSAHNQTISALRAIMAQFLQVNRSNRHLLDACTFAMLYTSHGQATATKNELEDLILMHLRMSESARIILDGIDEAQNETELVRVLQDLASIKSCRLLLFSRPTVASLQRAVPKELQMEVSKARVESDIHLFLESELDQFMCDGLLPASADISQLADQLTFGADGMFLWARLMTLYLASPVFHPSRRMQIIHNVTFPEGLDYIYNRICKLILARYERERDLASRVLVWLTYGMTHLDTMQLREAITPIEEAAAGSAEDQRSDDAFEDAVLWACAGLVERFRDGPASETQHRGFRFIHLSVKEFFSQSAASDDGSWWAEDTDIRRLIPMGAIAHMELARTCVHYLTYHAPAQPFSGDAARETDPLAFRRAFPFSSYAAPFWTRHLQATMIPDSGLVEVDERGFGRNLQALTDSLRSFVAKPLNLMSWIEAHYLAMKLLVADSPHTTQVLDLYPRAGFISEWAHWLTQWAHTLPSSKACWSRGDTDTHGLKDLSNNLREFEHDIQDLQLHWGANLLKSPELIWDEVAAFSPSRFLLKTTSTNVISLAPQDSPSSANSSNPLCLISEVATGGNLMAILSIWPSKLFEERWDKLTPTSDATDLESASCGWKARYQLWNIEKDPSQVADIRIPCDSSEVSLLVRQSLRFQIDSGWKLSFPLAISRTCMEFTILRTVFVLGPHTQTSEAQVQSINLEIATDQELEFVWSDHCEAIRPFPCDRNLLPRQLSQFTNSSYNYSISFSPNGRFLFFADFEFNMNSHLIVWERVQPDAQAQVQYRVVANASHDIQQNEHIKHVAFHSSASLLVFCDATRLYRWEFFQEQPLWICILHHVVDRLCISDDAKFAIVDNTVVPIYPADRPRPPARLAIGDLPADQSDKATHPPSTSALSVRHGPLFQPGNVLRGTLLTGSSAPGSISLRVNSSVTLEVSTQTSQHILRLLALPQWPGLDHTFAIIRTPSEGNGSMFKVLLNKASSSSYDMSTAMTQSSLPLVVDRHAGAIRRDFVRTGDRLELIENGEAIARPWSPVSSRGMLSVKETTKVYSALHVD
ncbi:hypothetical protein B0T19DRAFT_268571 [Cercophora scortea]|uniref:NACHT domain-containing protein n=1 Tax=Cercophora scortea TaxID=314031 RepID=A0AAE0I6J5_9PEZI|nr:hypothetical protein B0T19DRAFT_268571 [Cercophora scortea]